MCRLLFVLKHVVVFVVVVVGVAIVVDVVVVVVFVVFAVFVVGLFRATLSFLRNVIVVVFVARLGLRLLVISEEVCECEVGDEP